MIRHTPLVRKITYILGFATIITGLLFMGYLLGIIFGAGVYQQTHSTSSDGCQTIWMQIGFGGSVELIRNDLPEPQIRLENQVELPWCEQMVKPKPGDSLVKEVGSQQVLLYKGSDSPPDTLSYSCCP